MIGASLLICLFIFLFYFNQIQKVPLVSQKGRTFEKAKVIAVVKDNLAEDGRRYGNQVLKLQMLTGQLKGKIVDATSDSGYLFGAACRKGMRVITITSVSGDINVTSVYSIDREGKIYIFIFLFLLVLCLIGGRKGFKSAVGLLFTFVCIIFLFLPMIYRGFSPFLAAVVAAVLTIVVSLYLVGGYTAKTLSAIMGSVCGVIISGICAVGFGQFAGITGFNVSDIESLLFVEQMVHIRIGELLFSGILISSLGAVMDIGMSVSSAMNEIHKNNPNMSKSELFTSGMSVGRDIIGTMANTLILAFAGGSLSILVLDYAYNLPYLQIINSYSVGIEIMQGIAGSLGVFLTVPLVSFFASRLMLRYSKAIIQ
jgi:Predicted multitransmembrane protein